MRAIFFDLDDTLYDQVKPFAQAFEDCFRDRCDAPAHEVFLHHRKHCEEMYVEVQAGRVTPEQMNVYRMQKALEDYGASATPEEVFEFQRLYKHYQFSIELNPVMKEILTYCKDHGVLGILSNGAARHQWDKIETLKLIDWVPLDLTIVSGDYPYGKPDVEIFRLAERLVAKDNPEEFIYVGDSVTNDIGGSKNAGWTAVWFDRRGVEFPSDKPQPDYVAKSEEELFELIKKIL